MASPQRKPEPTASLETTDFPEHPEAGGVDPALKKNDGYYEGMQVTPPDRRDGFIRAFIHVLVAAVLFGGGLYLYWGKVERDKHVHELAVEARAIYLRDNYRDLREGDRLLTEALETNPRHRYSIAARGLINAYLWMDHGVTEARALAESFTADAEERGAHLQERYGARGLLLLGGGDPAETERMLREEVLEEGGTGPAILGAMGLAQRLQGKRAEARGALQRASEAERRSPRFNYWIAQMYFDGEEYGNAATFIERSLDVNPDHIHTLVLRSRNDIAGVDNIERAERTLTEILDRSDRELSPRARSMALIGMAELHNAHDRHEEAIASADQALEIAADIPDALIVKGLSKIAMEQDGGLEIVKEGLDMFPYMSRAYHRSAKVLVAAEQFDAANEFMEMWGENVTRNAPYHVAYGNILLQQENPIEARAQFERALELHPRAAEAHYQLGMIALNDQELGDERVPTAIEHFNTAVRARERYPEVYEAMGWIYMDQRAWGDSLRQFVQAINHYQNRGVEAGELHDLRERVGDALRRHRQHRVAQMWMQESRALVHDAI